MWDSINLVESNDLCNLRVGLDFEANRMMISNAALRQMDNDLYPYVEFRVDKANKRLALVRRAKPNANTVRMNHQGSALRLMRALKRMGVSTSNVYDATIETVDDNKALVIDLN